ncbi:MAG: hypothetical protein H0W73_00365 [Bacteroidetes bacterium]|nr:hypothetical protein [Bacteroidota bacterium]
MVQLLDPKTGEFSISKDFIVSAKTTIEDLVAYFGESALQVRDFENGHSNYTVRDLKIADLYFILTFYFVNNRISKLSVLVQELPYNLDQKLPNSNSSGWDNFNEKDEIKKGDFIKLWFAHQMHNDYKKYDWGKADVYYDFHNLSSSCLINYNMPIKI